MQAKDNGYLIRTSPLEPSKSSTWLSLSGEFTTGPVLMQALDRVVTIGNRQLKLSDLRSLYPTEGHARLGNGQEVEGRIGGLAGVDVQIGTQTVALNLGGCSMISIKPPAPPTLTCTLVVRSAGREIGRSQRIIDVSDPVDWNCGSSATSGIPGIQALVQGVFKKPRRAASRQTYLNVLSTPGEYIGQGWYFSWPKQSLGVGIKQGILCVWAEGNGKLEIAPGRGKMLEIGEYDNTRNEALNDTMPAPSFSINDRRSIRPYGKFVIWEIRFKHDEISELAVDFIQRNEINGPPLVGRLRINSTLE